ncbi:protein Son-like isoform X2 [Pararge aegeria]|uniref:protein Son-like isoform X2 n=1 Tax=Pararge aegeria TaxID=116150 RepID=UPI0019CFF861|nr:protein Son-like isoform X2 [Pararge aegeria]
MTTLIDKIEMLIKREKTTPERKKEDTTKSSSEILSELFSAFNADPPKIEEIPFKKSKKGKKKHEKDKKKHKKDKKKRSRSSSSSSASESSDYSHKRKKRKKSKPKKRPERSPSTGRSCTPLLVNFEPEKKIKKENIKKENIKKENIKKENIKKENIKTENIKKENKIVKIDQPEKEKLKVEKDINNECPVKVEKVMDKSEPTSKIDASSIPMPVAPTENKTGCKDLRLKLDKKQDAAAESDKAKSKIQIKNLKFSAVFEETVKKAEEEARKKAEKEEEGELTDSSNSSVKEDVTNSNFPKSADPGGILKKQAAEEIKVVEEKILTITKPKITEKTHKSSRRDRSRSKKRDRSRSKKRDRSRSKKRDRSRSKKRSRSKSRRSRSGSTSKRSRPSSTRSRRRSRSSHRSRSRRRTPSRIRHRSPPKVQHRSRLSPRHRGRRSRSPTGVKLADSEKKRLLEVARRNAINMLKNGAVPAGAAVLPPHTRNQVMAAIQSGGKSVDELTDFCKHLSKKEALGELSSVSSNDDGMSENEDTIAFHHPFLVKEKAPIVMNIRGGAPLPIKTNALPVANKEELRLQFPVSSGSQHREKASEWVPVSPKRGDMQVAKLNSRSPDISSPPGEKSSSEPLALPAPPSPTYLKSFTSGSQLASVPAIAAPGPQAYPPRVDNPKLDMAIMVSQKLSLIRKEQEQNESDPVQSFGWAAKDSTLGQFTGSTGAQILTPRELASGTQAWAKKDQLVRAAPVEGGMGMHLLQKMGWTPGQGLGKEGTGTLQPLLLEVKLDTRGLTSKEEVTSRHGKSVKTQRGGSGRRCPAPLVAGGKHPVSLLGEYCSKQKLGPPEYSLCFECGPDHKKNFLFKVKVAGVEYQPAVASANKKQAKADSAQLALQKLGIMI